ncbi:MAG: T9SS type A sorting domain-containing protein [Bacteroidia bacterium]|nr:T9SS type A sorting domain-containing protein [Bacteroidia bacterium]
MKKIFTIISLQLLSTICFCSISAYGANYGSVEIGYPAHKDLSGYNIDSAGIAPSEDAFAQHVAIPDKGSVSVYPNPFQSTVQVTLPAGANRLEIRNMVGQVVFSQENIESTTLMLYLGHLAPGPYFMSVFVGAKHELLRIIRE